MGRRKRQSARGKKKKGGSGKSSSSIVNESNAEAKSDHQSTELRFQVGDRVECNVCNRWEAGVVIETWYRKHSIEGDGYAPYQIQLDTRSSAGEYIYAPLDDDCCIRSSTAPPLEPLRFKAGDRVSCLLVSDEWVNGTVIDTWYNDSQQAKLAPYQIQPDTGGLLFAPRDKDDTIKKTSVPSPPCWICFDNEQDETNLIVRQCACRGDMNGFVHVDCLTRLALSKTLQAVNPNPLSFTHCLTCNQPYDKNLQCFEDLAVACYESFGHQTGEMAICADTLMSQRLVSFGDWTNAVKLVNKRIKLVQIEIILGTVKMTSLAQLQLHLAKILEKISVAWKEERAPSLKAMKTALDESLSLIGSLAEPYDPLKIIVASYLARHTYLTGNKESALEQYEECLELAKAAQESSGDLSLVNLLLQVGYLNFELGNEKRGIEQISDGVDLYRTIYGSDHNEVSILEDCLKEVVDEGHTDQLDCWIINRW